MDKEIKGEFMSKMTKIKDMLYLVKKLQNYI